MLNQKISEDLKEAMKAGKEFETGVLRMLLSSLHNKEIEKRGKSEDSALSDEEIVEVLSKEAKKRKEAAEIFNNAGRQNLAEKELRELELVKKYLPEQVGAEEIERVVKAVIERIVKDPEGKQASYGARFGKVMAEAMKDLKG
ncbi:hypothetical protein A3J77_01290, partial [Candidatus Wolfebacteria bacterium RBG_13_41_7]